MPEAGHHPGGELRRIAIVGASLAGVHAAQTLRRREFDGEIVLVGDEPDTPYDRPPLSKGFLAGSTDEDRLLLRPTADPDALDLDRRLGRRAIALAHDTTTGASAVSLDDGAVVEADGLVVATGARLRTLPATDGVAGVFGLRTLADARSLRAALDEGPDRVVVVGFGFIGAEVAATVRERGIDVTIVEAADQPLARVLDPDSGAAIAAVHRDHGVDVRLGATVESFDTADGRLAGVQLSDGSRIEASVAVVGIGVIPNTEWLTGTSLTVDNGLVLDESTLAAPGVVGAGDVARWPNQGVGGALVRIEQWDNAVEMGGVAADRLLSWAAGVDGEPYAPIPWFWSDQYDRKYQLAGLSGPEYEVVQGGLDEERFVVLYRTAQGAPCGVLCGNRPRQAIVARQLLAAGAGLDEFHDRLS
ncbi:MAG: FAD-dependent oxidoreductase [Actinomycetota bacterium]